MIVINSSQSHAPGEIMRLKQGSHLNDTPSTTVTDEPAKEQGDAMSPSDREEFFSEKNQVSKFLHRDLFKKVDVSENSARQLENYKQQFEDNQTKQRMNEAKMALLTDSLKEYSQFHEDLPNSSSAARAADQQAENKSKSSKDFCKEIAKDIKSIKEGYLDVYYKALENYVKFFQSVSTLLSELAKLISDGSDNKVKIDATKLEALLKTLQTDTEPRKNSQLFPSDSNKSATKSQAEDWAKKFGLPDSCIKQAPDRGWYVKVDMSPIEDMIKGLDAIKTSEVSSAKYQAWKAGFDANVEKIQNLVQTLSQKYTSATSTYDNLVKVLSSTITTMYDADKEFLKN